VGDIAGSGLFAGIGAHAGSGARSKGKMMRMAVHLGRSRPGLVLAALTAMAVGALSPGAWVPAAHAADPPASQAWKRLDRDSNGSISFEEFVRASDERLKRMDKNGDGNIGRDEFMAYHEAEAGRRVDRIFAALDTKGTGRIAASDLKGADLQRFLVCDGNKDRAITRHEYLQCRRRVAERWMQRIFAKYDRNGDGFIGREERVAALREFFKKLDTTGDNRVSREEFGVAQKRWADRRSATTSNSRPPQSDLDELE
jgi:Ca2+-binding EF-hand superfamily protein